MRRLAAYIPVCALLCGFDMTAQVKMPLVTESNSLIRFTENKNQWDKNILYRAQLDGGALWVEKNALTYGFYDKETYRKSHVFTGNAPIMEIRTTGFRVSFAGMNPAATIESRQPTRDYCNYFIGKDPKKWAGNVHNYQTVVYHDLWKGIHLEAVGQDNSVKYNFYVQPGADARDIKLVYDKADEVLLENEELIIRTQLNELVEHKPYAYQLINGQPIEVPCKFKLKNKTVSFVFPKGYSKKHELVIDPVLVFACSSGSKADNFGMTATYDNRGNLYSGGTAFNNGFPVVNAYDSTFNGVIGVSDSITDVVVTKYDSAGAYLHYSTYIGGGAGSEIVTSLVVDAQNNLYLYGATGSNDFPVTPNAYDKTYNGGKYLYFSFNGTMFRHGTDIYVAKLSAGGDQLLASTYIGGSENDGVNTSNAIATTTYSVPMPGNCGASQGVYTVTEPKADSLQYNYGDQYRGEIQLDNFGLPVISSSSRSPNFPTYHAIDSTLGGWQDAVLFKFDQNLSQLQWSTFIGGNDNDAGYALCISKANEVYTTGGTRSSDFPVTTGAYTTTYGAGKCDGYVTKISPNGSTLLAASYIGTNDYDQSYFVQLDKGQNVYLYGQSLGNMPVVNAGYSNPNSKLFVAKLDNNLSQLLMCTVLGSGSGLIELSPAAFSVDYCQNIYLTGWGGNIIKGPCTNNLPLTSNAFQSTNPDGYNFYVMNLSQNAGSLLFASYFGGASSHEHVDGGTSRFDKNGIIYQSVCAGCWGNSDFPVTPGAWPTSVYGNTWNQTQYGCNNGTFKMDFKIPLVTANFSGVTSGCAPLTVQFTNLNTNDSTYFWDFGNNDTTSTIPNPTHTYTVPGTYTVQLIAHNPISCNLSDTLRINVTVFPSAQPNFTWTKNNCGNTISFTDSSNNTLTSWHWDFGDGATDTVKNPVHSYANPGSYTITLAGTNQNGCPDTIRKILPLNGFNPISVSATQYVCKGDTVQLNAAGGISYHWSPASSLSNANIADPLAFPTTNTHYTVTITQVNGIDTCVANLSTLVIVPAYSYSALAAYATPDTIYQGQSSQLGTYTSGGNVVWSPNYNISDIHDHNPTVTPEHTTTYTVQYTDAHGCNFPMAPVTVYVIAKDCNESTVFVPNTFTPNGDGVNDIMYARSNMLTEVEFRIYDRWGQEVFYTNDISKGWNGIFEGKPCNPDVFGYYIRYTCNNGKKSFKKGNITLIR